MRSMYALILASLALCGCASDEHLQMVAESNCNAVGITEKDPEFATCRESFRLQVIESRIRRTYSTAQRSLVTEADRRKAHPDIYSDN